MTRTAITFIGGGNMSRALISGLLETDSYRICAADPGREARHELAELGEVEVFSENAPAVEHSSCVIFAVKPQIMQLACSQIKPQILERKPLLVSIAAGIESGQISRWFDGYKRIVRVMPNTPALVGAGASALFGADGVDQADRDLVTQVFASCGIAEWLDEEALIDVATALSGSGPAYFFYWLEAMEKAAIDMGLPKETARRLARQTATGAALMASEEPGDLAVLRERVTSPGGTTAAALGIFADNNMASTIELALNTARTRAQELATEFGKR